MRVRTPYPTGPFPYLIEPTQVPSVPPSLRSVALTALQRQVLQRLRNGAHLFFDLTAKRALLYDFKCGLRTLAELTVRSLAGLVRNGFLRVVQRDGQRVHYELI